MIWFNFFYIIKSRLLLPTILNSFLVVSVFAEVENIDNHTLQSLISVGVPIVDIREDFEWKETGIVPRSHLITFFDSEGKYDVKKWLNKVDELTNEDHSIIIICRSGRRSLILANYLSDQRKFPKIYNVTDGIKGWKKANFKTQSVE